MSVGIPCFLPNAANSRSLICPFASARKKKQHRGLHADRALELFGRLHLDELDTGAAHAVVIGIAMRFLDDYLVLHAA